MKKKGKKVNMIHEKRISIAFPITNARLFQVMTQGIGMLRGFPQQQLATFLHSVPEGEGGERIEKRLGVEKAYQQHE